MITSLYAALLTLIYVYLSIGVIKLRRKFRISIGDGNNPLVARAVRVHANFSEYVPLAIILIYFVETQTQFRTLTHVLGSLLLIARLFHAYGLRSETADFRFRVGGMVLTFSVLLVSSCVLLWPVRATTFVIQ